MSRLLTAWRIARILQGTNNRCVESPERYTLAWISQHTHAHFTQRCSGIPQLHQLSDTAAAVVHTQQASAFGAEMCGGGPPDGLEEAEDAWNYSYSYYTTGATPHL